MRASQTPTAWNGGPRVADQTDAGPVAAGEGGVGPALRTWTVELPAGLGRNLSANARHHHMVQHKLNKKFKAAAAWCARAAHVPHLEQARIVAEYRPPDRRRRDPDNLAPQVKAAIDGIVQAGVLTDDSSRYVTSVEMRIDEDRRVRGGQLVLHITELPEEAR